MAQLKYWFKLSRPLNLFILLITQYFIHEFIVLPNFEKYGILSSLNEIQFFLLVFSVLIICAAGYIINDYYDISLDAVNKPQKQIIGKYISQPAAFNAYCILTCVGLIIGVYISIDLHFWKLVTIHIVCIILLYFYSASYKKIPFLGNIIVAILTSISIVMVAAFEPHLYMLQRPADYYAAHMCWVYILALSAFAFLLTLIREIVKDIEDIDGDEKFSARTIPVEWGITAAKRLIYAIAACTIFALLWYIYLLLPDAHILYILLAIIITLCLLYMIYAVVQAKEKRQYSRISNLLKIIMIAGILIMPLYYCITF